MSRLKQHHLELLQRLVEEGGISADQLDGRILRPLRSLGLVEVSAGTAAVTRTGREKVSPRENGSVAVEILKLSHAQEDLLRMLVRQRGIPAEDADARFVPRDETGRLRRMARPGASAYVMWETRIGGERVALRALVINPGTMIDTGGLISG